MEFNILSDFHHHQRRVIFKRQERGYKLKEVKNECFTSHDFMKSWLLNLFVSHSRI